NRNISKVLLLGLSESGKSTLGHSMVFVADPHAYNENHRRSYKAAIFETILLSMRTLLEFVGCREDFMRTIYLQEPKFHEETLPVEMTAAIASLWTLSRVHEGYARSPEHRLGSNIEYYMANIERIGTADYCPTIEDILRLQVKTFGISERLLHYQGSTYMVSDVGTRGESKWIHCFENTDVVLLTVDTCAYAGWRPEGPQANEMWEQYELCNSMLTNTWLTGATFILVLTRIDRLEEQLRRYPIQEYF
ncbi:hypothetical protein EV356DRAFT_423887, partial [Viridothelium virens]